MQMKVHVTESFPFKLTRSITESMPNGDKILIWEKMKNCISFYELDQLTYQNKLQLKGTSRSS